MIFRLSILLLFISSLLISCSTGPDFERDSIHDPKSDDFELKMPKGKNYEIQHDGSVALSWKDNEDIEEGYRIFKVLGNNAEPQFLTQLPENSTSFIDSTKNFAFPTTYYVVSYYQNIHSDTLEIDIDFGNLSKFTTEFENGYEKINLTWNGNIPFADGYEIRSKRDSNASAEVINRVSNATSKLVINTPNKGFNYEYSITPYKIYDGKITYLESLVSQISIGPVITNLDLLTPDSLQIKWKNLTISEESFEIIIENSAGTKSYFANKGTWNTIVNNDFEKDEIYTVKIRAFDSNHSSPFADKKLTINPPKTSITNIIGESNTQATLQINDPSGIRREHTVYRSTYTDGFIEIGKIPRGQTTFVDHSLDVNNKYTYYISSPLSNNSDEYDIRFAVSFKLIDSNFFAHGKTFTSDGLHTLNMDNNTIAFLTRDNYWYLHVDNYLDEEDEKTFKLNNGLRHISINSDASTVIGTDLDLNDIHVFDIASGTMSSVELEDSYIIDIEFLQDNNEAVSILRPVSGDDYLLAKINLATSEIDTLGKLDFKDNNSKIHTNALKDRFVIVQSVYNTYGFQYFKVTETDIEIEKTEVITDASKSFSTFSANLDTTLISTVNNQSTLQLYDLNSNSVVESYSNTSINNYNDAFIRLLNNGVIFYDTYLFDPKLPNNQYADKINLPNGFRSTNYLWNAKNNTFIWFMNNDNSSNNSKYYVYRIEPMWNKTVFL